MADYRPPHPPVVPNWLVIVGALGIVVIVIVIFVTIGMGIEAFPRRAGTQTSYNDRAAARFSHNTGARSYYDASVAPRSSHTGGGNSRPSGVTDYGWDNWRQLSDDEKRMACAAMRNIFAIEANAARVAIESGAALPARGAEPAEAADMRLLCDVPAPDYQKMQADRVRQEAQEQAEREVLVRDRYDEFYRELRPSQQEILCLAFKSAGEDSFTYNRAGLDNLVAWVGWEPISSAEDVQHLEAMCRRHRDRR